MSDYVIMKSQCLSDLKSKEILSAKVQNHLYITVSPSITWLRLITANCTATRLNCEIIPAIGWILVC